jgi:cobalt-zinc-cadmium efflux system outer membrane protein
LKNKLKIGILKIVLKIDNKIPYINVLFFLIILFISSAVHSEESIGWKESIRIANKNNPAYDAEKLNIEIARSEVITSSLLPNPNFNNQVIVRGETQPIRNAYTYPQDFSGNTIGVGGRKEPFHPFNRQDWFQLTMRIPVAGQRQFAIELAKNNLRVARENLKEFQRNLFFITANKWLDVWLSGEKVKLYEKAKKFSSDLLKVNELRLKNEVITKTEYSRTKILDQKYLAQLSVEQVNLANENRKLGVLLGTDKDFVIRQSDLIDIPSRFESEEELYRYSYSNRPDLVSYLAQLDSARKEVDLEESFAYPQPEVGIISNPQNGEKYYGTFLTLPLPVFNRNQGNILKSKSTLSKKQEYLKNVELNLRTEIRNSLAEFKIAKENYDRYKEIFELSEKVLETVRYGYLKGGTTIVDFLEAQRNWLETQSQYYDSFWMYRKSYIQLLYVSSRILEVDKE